MQLEVVLRALSMLSGDAEALRHTEEGMDANAVSPLSLLALLLLPLGAALGLPWWLLLLWLLTTRVSPVAVTRLLPLSPLLWLLLPLLCFCLLPWLPAPLLLLCWGCCLRARLALALLLVFVLGAWDTPAPEVAELPQLGSFCRLGAGSRKAGIRLPLLCRLSSLLRSEV